MNKYHHLTPVESFPSFIEMSSATAKRHFNWFVGESEHRVQALQDLLRFDQIELPTNPDDEAILKLSTWLSNQIEVVPKHVNWNSRQKKILDAIDASPSDFSERTMSLIVDSSFYVASYFINISSAVKWNLWTKRGRNFNKPVLIGFGRIPLVPSHLVSAAAWAWIESPAGKVDELARRLAVWREMIESA
jgi:hypothetical protein